MYTVPTDAPEGDSTLTWDSTTMAVVQVSGGGATGLGSTYGPAATAQVVEQQLADVLTGRCAWDVPAANEAMNRAVRNAGRPGLTTGAVSAVDIAGPEGPPSRPAPDPVSQQTDDNEPGTRTTDLWHPAARAPEHDYGAHGSFGGSSHSRSAQAALARHPGPVPAGATGAVAVGRGAVIRRRGLR